MDSRPLRVEQLTQEELALYNLAYLAGTPLNPRVLRNLLGLLRLQCSPTTVFGVLQAVAREEANLRQQRQ
ncbi:hypothetical protein BOX15_Mlig013007g5 [Macrostomum lignano]|uniref:Uncharacterized protein n=1 Tax=Macrostomum lignano TaxID=282301 RepID=A0A267FLJ2_9PLAT|nr:hypothetical protein BOX15_Mlig013007g5 [Macrostomum lignano]